MSHVVLGPELCLHKLQPCLLSTSPGPVVESSLSSLVDWMLSFLCVLGSFWVTCSLFQTFVPALSVSLSLSLSLSHTHTQPFVPQVGWFTLVIVSKQRPPLSSWRNANPSCLSAWVSPPALLKVTTSFALENSTDLEQIFKVFRGKIKYLNGTAK